MWEIQRKVLLGTPFWSMISSLLHLVGLRPRVYYTLTNFRGGGQGPLGPPPQYANELTQARVQGGGPKGPGPPPLEIEKQKKKKKKKVIRANIKLFHLYFATFLVENVFFSASF